MATEIQTPIRMMQAAMLYIELSMPEGEQRSQYSADTRAALEDVKALVAALLKRCSDHQLPIEFEPQGDAQYPLTGWYHPLAGKPSRTNRTGIVYSKCELTDAERIALGKFHEVRCDK